ncbi:Lsr2 family protein [Kribbella sp. NPDC026611]|uniref:histone-like nucleoid-structuring protein Lsr2 n=1 Tax=Kribbella sp. NPDC026611 TaxID=3154911 RepID=UPI0033EA5809
MSRRFEVVLTDDLDGSRISPGKGDTITFALDGQTYEIDLTQKNATALRKALSPYLAAGRRVTTPRGTRVRKISVGADARTVKEWARANGHEVNGRGRVPNAIRAAFDAAN